MAVCSAAERAQMPGLLTSEQVGTLRDAPPQSFDRLFVELMTVHHAGAVAMAERGRRRAGGANVFPASCSLMAPLWLLERALCSWVALANRVVWGGCRYRGRTMYLAATSTRELRRRLAAGPEGRLRHYRGVPTQRGSGVS